MPPPSSTGSPGPLVSREPPPFERAVDEVAAPTGLLLDSLQARTAVRTREGERERARIRWQQRISRPGGLGG